MTISPGVAFAFQRAGGLQGAAPPLAVAAAARNAAATSLTMGLATTASTVVLKDFSAAATGFFGGVRIPASLIAGSSLAALFSLTGMLKDMEFKSRTEQVLIKAYHVSAFAAFLLSISAVVVSTAAGVTILHGGFDPMAETGYMLLKGQLEYEFVTTRWSFLMSLFFFLSAVSSRVLLEFNLLKESNKDALLFVTFSMTALLAHLLSYINSTLYCWPNLIGMTFHLVKLVTKRAFGQFRPLQLISWVSCVLSLFHLLKGFFPPKQEDGS